MVFSSMIFLWVFLPAVFIIGRFLPVKAQNVVLLIASLVFYAWGEPVYILLMLLSITMNWGLGLVMEKSPKLVLTLAVVANIGLLFYFKYFDFAAATVNGILRRDVVPVKNIALPIGISFFTFQAMSYVIDLYRGEVQKEKNIFYMALYISYFPQLIAGPIVKYKEIRSQITDRKLSADGTALGIRRFIYGLGKKVLIANTLGAVADKVYGTDIAGISGAAAWIGAVFYMLQIYYDFSGYSDMAIGLGGMFGFEIPENFNLPYISTSVGEFWRRWHISLGSWFREYLYIPLGGNRKGIARTYVNLIIVFAITGLWHGASFTFILWGLYHGIWQILERMGLGKIQKKLPVVAAVLNVLIVMFGWVIFRADSVSYAVKYIFHMLLPWKYTYTPLVLGAVVGGREIAMLVAGVLLCGPLQLVAANVNAIGRARDRLKCSWIEVAFLILVYVLCVLALAGSTYNPFIYFRF